MPDWHAIQANAGTATRFELREGYKRLLTVTTSKPMTLAEMLAFLGVTNFEGGDETSRIHISTD